MVEQHANNTLRVAAARRRLVLIGAGIAVLILAALAGATGQGAGAFIPMLVLTASEVAHAWPAAIYLIAAHGLGRLLTPIWSGARDRAACQFACGLAVMLSLSHLMGVMGLLSPAPALALCAIGVALTVRQVLGPPSVPSGQPLRTVSTMASWVWLAAVPAAAVVVAAMAVPPGVLWSSEFGGFDVLSYHLQLPQEWIANGRIWPVEHNVYSYLPGYMESAYAHVAVMSFPPTGEALVGDGGWRLTSAKALHVGMWGSAAWLTARAATAWLVRAGCDSRDASHAGAVGGVLVAATPWTVVVGSMAYNEMAVIALGAGAVLIAAESDVKPRRRGVIAGLLIGVAAGAKPSAALMLAPIAGAALLGLAPYKHWRALIIGGMVAGAAAVLPWLVRNAVATGNPVFPFATGVFGTGHWTAEQASRWASGHHASGSLLEHLRLLVGADPSAPTSAPTIERHRGFSNPQWGAAPWAGLVAVALLWLAKPTRRFGLMLTLGSAGALGVWLLLTHHQSRFLLPMALPIAMAAGLLCGMAASLGGVARMALGIGAVIGLVLSGQTWKLWSNEGGGAPAQLLGNGSMFFTGELFTPEDRAELPIGFVRLFADELGGKVYLLGESTPLYWPGGSVYHTTWDDGPMAGAMRRAPDDPDAWTSALRDAGIGAVMVSRGELARLGSSGWLAPELNAANVAELMARCRVIRSWPGRGMTLLAVPGAAVEPGVDAGAIR